MFERMKNAAREPQGNAGWIPVSERLPEDGDVRFYMCVVENHEEDLPMFCQYEEDRGFGFWRDYYDADTLGFVDSEFQTNEELGYEKVVAWMPLPEPYRESEVNMKDGIHPEGYAVTKKKTNADRIRSMTNDELLDFLCSIEIYEQGSAMTIEGGVAMCSVTDVEQWLKAESEDANVHECD